MANIIPKKTHELVATFLDEMLKKAEKFN